jgi:hypothetical protein
LSQWAIAGLDEWLSTTEPGLSVSFNFFIKQYVGVSQAF